MKSEMTHRERIMAAINHEPTDRVPTDYWGVPEITEKLMKKFGVNDDLGFAKALDIDKIMGVSAPLKPIGRKNMWDVETQKIPIWGGAGFYEEPVREPLANYDTIDEIEANYIWPTVDMFDYSGIKERCKFLRDEGYAIEGGYISLNYFHIIIRGVQKMFEDLAMDSELSEYLIFKMNEFASANTKRILEEADGLVDISQVTDDFGSQHGLLMSKDMIERYYGKYYDSNISMVKSYGAKVFHHNDGAITEIIPWIIDKGCDILNPIQWHLPGWDLHKIKRDYGNKLCFHGGMDNQKVMPFGDSADVRAEVEACVDALYSDKTGYILAPCHALQAITPVENVIEMFEHAKVYSSRV